MSILLELSQTLKRFNLMLQKKYTKLVSEKGVDEGAREYARFVSAYKEEALSLLASAKELQALVFSLSEERPDLEGAWEREYGGTLVVKRVPCGKNCRGCPHGPYAYRVKREGEHVKWRYLGRAHRLP